MPVYDSSNYRQEQAYQQALLDIEPYLDESPLIRKALTAFEAGQVWRDDFDDIRCWSSDGVNSYHVKAEQCPCAAGSHGKLCYHRVARRIYLLWERYLAAIIADEQGTPVKPARLKSETRWRWKAGKLPRKSTIKKDQERLGERCATIASEQRSLRRIALCGTLAEGGAL